MFFKHNFPLGGVHCSLFIYCFKCWIFVSNASQFWYLYFGMLNMVSWVVLETREVERVSSLHCITLVVFMKKNSADCKLPTLQASNCYCDRHYCIVLMRNIVLGFLGICNRDFFFSNTELFSILGKALELEVKMQKVVKSALTDLKQAINFSIRAKAG